MQRGTFAKLAWGALGYNLLVIAWGAYVRASGSGAGCGAHWPLCNGEVVPHKMLNELSQRFIPHAPATKTLIELSHRLSSGLVLVIAIAMVVFAFRTFPRGSEVRRGSVAVLGFTITEALVGAGLVLFELVAHDTSMKRALSMSLHLVNTFFLLGALALTARAATRAGDAETHEEAEADEVPALLRGLLVVSAAALMLVAMSGGIAALGDTLFPATTFMNGLAQELSTGAHVLLRLRVLHPLFAVATAALVLGTSTAARALRKTPAVTRLSHVVAALVTTQLGLGVLNVGLLAPIWLQLVHLFAADLLFIAFVLLWAETRGVGYERSTTRFRPARLAS